MLKYAKVLDKNTGMCAVGLGDDSKYYTSIGMQLLDVIQNVDGNWILVEKVNHDDYQEQIEAKRKCDFEKDFFKTSLGWIRRVVNMKNGDKKDFLSDLLLQIKAGLEMGQEVQILTYNTPDYTNELTPEYLISLQEIKEANFDFIKECLSQLVEDWNGAE